jgi:hypothetical protein
MADVTVANTSPGVAGKTLACHDVDGTTSGLWTFTNPVALKGGTPGNQTWRLSVQGSGNVTLVADGTGLGLSMNTAGSPLFSGDITEKSRIAPIGHWQDTPFNAANFATNVGTWVVDVGDVALNRYTLVGKTLIWNLQLGTTSLGGAANYLLATVPTGAIQTVAPGRVAQAKNNGALCEAWCFRYSSTQVGFSLVDGTNWAAAANTTTVVATVILELA